MADREGVPAVTRPFEDGEPGPLEEEPRRSLELWDWRRSVADLYAVVRSLPPEEGWQRWRAERDRRFAAHPQSPIPPGERSSFGGLAYFDYDPGLRALAEVGPPGVSGPVGLPHSGDGITRARPMGTAHFEIGGRPAALPIFRLLAYGDGFFVPFRDLTNGHDTYGGGRYLIDTVKGADLGGAGGIVVLDFNFSYHPSCVYDPSWSCPLAPQDSNLPFEMRAGERLGPR